VVESDSLLQVVFRNGVQNPLVNALEVSRIESPGMDLVAATDSLSVSCSGQTGACVRGAYTVEAAEGDTLTAVAVSFLYRETPEDPGTVVYAEVDSAVTAGVYQHVFCFDLGPSYAGTVEMILDPDDALVESAEANNAVLQAVDCLGVSTPAARAGWHLARAVPNPFNPRTRISFSIAEAGRVRLKIYDVSGRLVRILVDETMGAGEHAVIWNGEDRSGSRVSSGVYYYRLESSSFVATERMTLLR
jgi:hypothetical protein